MIEHTTKMRETKVLSKIICNWCGTEIEPYYERSFEFATLVASWGYGSSHDMDAYELHLCENCVYEKIMPFLAVQPHITEVL